MVRLDFPNADVIAEVIVAASRETGADPIKVAEGFSSSKPCQHARAYAAMALRSRSKASASYIGRVVGAGSPHVYLSMLSQRVSSGEVKWWDDAVFERVSEVAGAALVWKATPEPVPGNNEPASPAPPPRPRPHHYPGKRDMYEDLRRAVENTAKLPTEP